MAELRLGRWAEVRHRLLARLVPLGRAGPLAQVPPTVPGLAPPALRFDVGVDVPGGIVRLDRELIRSLAVDPRDIWRRAVTNLARLDPPKAIRIEAGATTALTVLAGGPWTTGLLLDPNRLDQIIDGAPSDGPDDERRAEPVDRPRRPTVAVAPHPEVLVVGRADIDSPSAGATRSLEPLVGSTLAMARALAEADGGSRLALAPLLVSPTLSRVLSRAGGFWNDVPVSEQPGLR